MYSLFNEYTLRKKGIFFNVLVQLFTYTYLWNLFSTNQLIIELPSIMALISLILIRQWVNTEYMTKFTIWYHCDSLIHKYECMKKNLERDRIGLKNKKNLHPTNALYHLPLFLISPYMDDDKW